MSGVYTYIRHYRLKNVISNRDGQEFSISRINTSKYVYTEWWAIKIFR